MGKCFSVCVGNRNRRVHKKTSKVVQTLPTGVVLVSENPATPPLFSTYPKRSSSSGSGDIPTAGGPTSKQKRRQTAATSLPVVTRPPSDQQEFLLSGVGETTVDSEAVSVTLRDNLTVKDSPSGNTMPIHPKAPTSTSAHKTITSLFSRSSAAHQTPASGASSGNDASTTSSKRAKLSRTALDENVRAIFRRYNHLDPSPDTASDLPSEHMMGVNGVVQFLSDINLDPEDFRVLLFAWKCQARRMCQFSLEEFTRGFHTLQADSLNSLVPRLTEVAQLTVNTAADFEVLYKWAFDFALEPEKRSLLKAHAVAMWRVVFSVMEPPVLSRWIDFVLGHAGYQVISRDTWCMFVKFVVNVGFDFAQYTESDAWPTLMDEFVEHEIEAANRL